MLTEFSQSLLVWYDQNARQLPWRNHFDPYAIWVSEIMLQQTRVEAVIPFFNRWMQTFPNITSLANANQQDLLKLWEGLGYYHRAKNLQHAAKIILQSYNGKLPEHASLLETLPGIGKYTAGAIASMAFGKDAVALDGNIRRVLSRVFNLEISARSPAGEKELLRLAKEHLPPGRAGDFNQAMMDLGASICLPRSPHCVVCPLKKQCLSLLMGVQEQRPILPQKKKIPHYIVTAAIIRKDNTVLIAKRPGTGLLAGMWEFPGGKKEAEETLEQSIIREIQEELNCLIEVGEPFGIYQHAFTHFRITLHAFFCKIIAGEPFPVEANQIEWVDVSCLQDYPMGKVDRQISKNLTRKLT